MVQLVGKVNLYLGETSTENVRTEILVDVATFISKMFAVFGFRTRTDNLGFTEESSEASSEALIMPYLTTLRNFRDDIRGKAMARAAHLEFLQATDQVRFDLLKQGVSLDDRGVGEPALIKILSDSEKLELIKAQEEKEKRAAEKAAKREAQAKLEAQKVAEREAKAKIAPKDLWKDDPAYSQWDEDGIPTHNAEGEAISKSLKKKLTKQHEAQKKLYHDYEGQILE
jgi:cysteinyl-tRNA synthetase